MAEAVLSDSVGVDAIGLAEHHRPDFAISSPDSVLAVIAGRAERIDSVRPQRCSAPTTRFASSSAGFDGQLVVPSTEAGVRTWVGFGGSPRSVVRAVRHGLPLMIAIIGGDRRRLAPLVELYRRTLDELHHAPLPIGVHSPGHIAATDAAAQDRL